MKIIEKVSFIIASEASHVYIFSRQKFIKNAKNSQFVRVLKFAVKKCYQTFWVIFKHCVQSLKQFRTFCISFPFLSRVFSWIFPPLSVQSALLSRNPAPHSLTAFIKKVWKEIIPGKAKEKKIDMQFWKKSLLTWWCCNMAKVSSPIVKMGKLGVLMLCSALLVSRFAIRQSLQLEKRLQCACKEEAVVVGKKKLLDENVNFYTLSLLKRLWSSTFFVLF